MRYFVRNNTGKLIREFKPGIGPFIIGPSSELEIFDIKDTVRTPTKIEVEYVRYPAKQIAEAIVNDFASEGLEVIEREE